MVIFSNGEVSACIVKQKFKFYRMLGSCILQVVKQVTSAIRGQRCNTHSDVKCTHLGNVLKLFYEL